MGENGAYPKTSSQESYSLTVEPTTWKSSFEATREMVEDANFGKLKSRANIFATSYNRTREKYAHRAAGRGHRLLGRHRRAELLHPLRRRAAAFFQGAPVHHRRV